MDVLRVDPDHPDPGVVARAAKLLEEGEVIAGPSDTVYGFLGRPSRPEAIGTLRRLKGRDGPFIHLVASLESARSLAGPVPEPIWERIERVWPGPVTVVLPARAGKTIALRMPNLTLLVAIVSRVGEPLISTSANPAGAPPPMSAEEVLGAFPQDALPLLLDGGRAPSREPSTLVDLSGKSARVLRHGVGDPAPLLDPPLWSP
ncbi:MAG TPA: L-threonylcarbamoyladenylate synthase [Candidatus Eisenbacteria bacterium]|nr:L-threonylcarbamoyladenylate synthase [Candidatus Eisenbacteria bacterium]